MVLGGRAVRSQAPSVPAAFRRSLQAFNPDVSAIVDLYYHADDSREGVGHLLEEIAGFGHAHDDGDGHRHGPEEGFNLRHVELYVSADVDPYFKGSAIAAVDVHEAELETAEIETTALPWGLKLRGGKFYSDFGRINPQHSHQWDFVDRPLIHRLALGDHGLNDIGLQLTWLAPTPFYLLAGVEAFQGDNEAMFAHRGEQPLPSREGPRVGVGWLKAGPSLEGPHALQFGVFGAVGRHQEEHDGDGDGEPDHWLDGENAFWGGDLVYKYDASRPNGEGDFVAQAEYFRRRKDLDLVAHDLRPDLVGRVRTDEQDGYYVQAVYGVAPRWRLGARWEQAGLINESELPNGARESFGVSHRASLMVDFTPSEFSRIRLQVARGSYATEEGREEAFEVWAQWMISIGAHGAHKF